MRIGLLSGLILAILAVVFALQNPQPMEVNLLFFRTTGSTALVLILTFAFGVAVGLISSLPGRLRARRELKALRKKVDDDSASGSAAPDAPAPPSSSS